MLSTSATLPERDPGENYILDALPGDERTRLFSHMTLIEMPVGMVLYECSDELRYIYSPIDSIVSLVYVLENGASAEIAVVGNDGVIGMALFMGGRCNHTESCGRPERGLRLPARGRATQRRVHRHGDLLQVLLLYTQSLITQMAQRAICNRHHSLEQQLCRWLLLSLDRLPSNQLRMTQELIANMLGVRRESVTMAAGKLQVLEPV